VRLSLFEAREEWLVRSWVCVFWVFGCLGGVETGGEMGDQGG
jgi:hypothetical protein